MTLRSIWKGSIRFSLVTVPVEAFTAAEPEKGEIHLHQLHDECHSRIRYVKTCPIHGEVLNDEIVTGYEYEKDHYVIVNRNDVEKTQSDDHSIAIDTFISASEIDSIYYDGRAYYLVPETSTAEIPYAVLLQAMDKLDRCGMATVVLHGKQQICLIRAIDGVLTMMMLYYQSQIRLPNTVRDKVVLSRANGQEFKLAQQLIESSTAATFDFSKYEDRYTDRLKELIEAKIKGKEVIEPPQTEDEVPIINLMDALRQSVKKSRRIPNAKQARKALSSKLSREHDQHRPRRRKSS